MGVDESASVGKIKTDENYGDSVSSQNSLSSLENGSEKSAFLPYKPAATVLTNLQRGNTKAQAPASKTQEPSFHQKAAQGDLTKKDITKETNIDKLDENGLTPLMWASAYGQYQVVAALLKSSAKVDLANPLGQTALLFASFGGFHQIVKILLLNGANVNHKDLAGNSALLYAAHGNNPHTVHELLSNRANSLATNETGDTAYSIAVKNENYLGDRKSLDYFADWELMKMWKNYSRSTSKNYFKTS